jgi:hypothetical protein
MSNTLAAVAIAGAVLVAGLTEFDRANVAATPMPIEAPPQNPAGPPELPKTTVDTKEPAITGRTIHVPAGGSLQGAIDEAKPGDRITLQPAATYEGPFRLRPKTGDGWIVITTSATDLPKPGQRVTPADARRMPKITGSAEALIEAEAGAHHYRLVGLEVTPTEGASVTNLIQIGDDAKSVDLIPHHIIIDRSYLHGDAKRGTRRGVALNAAHAAVLDSYLVDFKQPTVDAQAISGWNGPGPFRIAGNYLEASGENIMFGGADPSIPNLVPSDIEIVRNHLTKPLRWKKDDPSFAGTEWAVKNLFELKNARRVLVEGNLIEHNWPQAQNGFAILFTVRNQDGGAPWSVVEDVTFRNNYVRRVAAGINVLGRDDNHPSQLTRRIAIVNNLFEDVGGKWGGNGRLFQLLDRTSGITIEHNTAFHTGGIIFAGDTGPHEAFTFTNNLMPHNEYGIIGSAAGPGNPTLQKFFPEAVIRGNVLIGAPAASYPKDNFYPASLAETGLSATSRQLSAAFAKKATNGRDPGVDVAALDRALGGLATVGSVRR